MAEFTLPKNSKVQKGKKYPAKAGAKVKMPAADMFWGDRYGQVTDPFGHDWSFSHPLTAEQKAAAEKAWAAMQGGKK